MGRKSAKSMVSSWATKFMLSPDREGEKGRLSIEMLGARFFPRHGHGAPLAILV